MKAQVVESKAAKKVLNKLPIQILSSYEIWAQLVEEHGSETTRNFKGYHLEKLSGQLQGYYSVRLNNKWRVIYKSRTKKGLEDLEVIMVERITAHDYRNRA